ncbi:MAG TPA: hypothetical protein VN947_01060 [Polyangia bacterium]|nr:hypothetical protein [Polyangia bacterium]
MILGLTLVFLGCGGSNNNNGTGGNGGTGGSGSGDMSGAAGGGGDMAMTLPPDMQPAYGCHALAACEDACTDQASCTLCQQSATKQARQLYQAASRCVRNECFPHPDGGPAPCTFSGGTPSADCTACQDDSIKMAGTCTETTYCGTCYSQYAACEADLP